MSPELERIALMLESRAASQEAIIPKLCRDGYQRGYSAGLALAYRESAMELRNLLLCEKVANDELLRAFDKGATDEFYPRPRG